LEEAVCEGTSHEDVLSLAQGFAKNAKHYNKLPKLEDIVASACNLTAKYTNNNRRKAYLILI
jgi:hypothetical protein